MDLAMHRSVHLSIDLFTRLSIDLSNPIAPIPCCASKTDACKSSRCVIFLRRPTVARSVSETKRMQNADATRMGQKKHHHSSNPTTTLVTTRSHAADSKHKTTSERPKCLRDPQFLTLLTSKCASRHNAVHFFDISTSKTAPNPSVFNTFYFQMSFAPERRTLFRHLNVQKCSETDSF